MCVYTQRTQPGYPSMGRRNVYQRQLERKPYRSGVAVVMRHKLSGTTTSYWLNGLGQGDKHSDLCFFRDIPRVTTVVEPSNASESIVCASRLSWSHLESQARGRQVTVEHLRELLVSK